ncbi:MAG: A/G-specific adenine glycosylase [Desulfomonilia bacterium]
MPWRDTVDPYCILVSEFMLQQTQTKRVLLKYGPFIARFPDFQTLSHAGLKDVLAAWQGLGYNRRVMHLKKTAEEVMARHHDRLPETFCELIRLPGIGKATAGAILAFAFNKPVVFIETNIRRAYIYYFFKDRIDIKDSEILPLVEATLDHGNPRHWYYALMDYGAMLKKQGANPNQKSAHYTKQAPFAGSDRQVRGAIIKQLLAQGTMEEQDLISIMGIEPGRAGKIFSSLEKDGFIERLESKILLK